jgi:hypothetical protein
VSYNNKEKILKLKNSLIESFKILEIKGDLSKEEAAEFKILAIENIQSLKSNNLEIQSKIIDE